MEMTAIHDQFHSVLNNYISSRVNNATDAEDLLQEVFIKIYKNMDSISRQESIKSWLFKITRNTLIDYYRKNANTKLIYDEKALNAPDDDEQAFDKTKNLEKCIHQFIDQLPEEYREIILDSEIKGIKQKDLAEKYDLPYTSLRSRVQRGRAKLKGMFLDCCKIEVDRRGNILSARPRSNKCR